MNKEEFLSKITELEANLAKEKFKLICKFVAENAKYKKGDRIYSANITLVVEGIHPAPTLTNRGAPRILYTGPELTKKGKFRKNKRINSLYQEQVVGCLQT